MPAQSYTNAAEDIAVRFLRASGITVLSRNDRRYGAEVDVLGRLKGEEELYIFEVKHWQKNATFPPVSAAQRKRLVAATGAIESNAGNRLSVVLYALLVDTARHSVCLVPLADYAGN